MNVDADACFISAQEQHGTFDANLVTLAKLRCLNRDLACKLSVSLGGLTNSMASRAVTLAVIVLLALSQPLAAQGQGNGNAGGRENGSGNQSENGNQNGNGNGDQRGNGHGNGNGNGAGGREDNKGSSGSVNASPGVNGIANSASQPSSVSIGSTGGQVDQTGSEVVANPNSTEITASEALALVQSGRAVPLEELLSDVRQRTGGEVIDAKLDQVGNFLVYFVTVITPAGKVVTERYYARSGKHVE